VNCRVQVAAVTGWSDLPSFAGRSTPNCWGT